MMLRKNRSRRTHELTTNTYKNIRTTETLSRTRVYSNWANKGAMF